MSPDATIQPILRLDYTQQQVVSWLFCEPGLTVEQLTMRIGGDSEQPIIAALSALRELGLVFSLNDQHHLVGFKQHLRLIRMEIDYWRKLAERFAEQNRTLAQHNRDLEQTLRAQTKRP